MSAQAAADPLLAVRGVKSFYGAVMALKGVDLEVHEGEIVTLIGANGAGKSTLMMTIFGKPRPAKAASSSPAATSPICRRTRSPACASPSRPRDAASSRA